MTTNRVANDKVFIPGVVETGTTEEQHMNYQSWGDEFSEMNEYDKAIKAYARVPSIPSFYPDAVYELVWVYIKNKSWADASITIDVFVWLSSTNMIRLELIRGRIQMNANNDKQYLN